MLKKLVLAFLALIIIVEKPFAQEEDKGFEMAKNLEIFSSVYRNIHINYVDEINPGELIKVAIDAMLAKLDPYTNYIPEANIEDVRLQLLGKYGGIGALIHQYDNKVVISEPYEGLPAHKAGLKAGDIVLEVNGESTKGKNSDEVREFLRGQAGSTIRIKVDRGGKTVEKKFNREEITLENVPYYGMLDNNIGYIKLNEFTNDATKNVLNAFKSLRKDAQLNGLVIDLRGNGGGLLNEAVSLVNIFVDKGEKIVSTKGKVAEKNQTFKTTNSPIDKDIPLVILIDRISASASEIVAGSLQDFDRAVVMGQNSFGKGLVQNIFPLIYNTQLKVTVSKYFIPSGRCIQAIDYSHRDEQGIANKIPDSLKAEFSTKGGRLVYDGFGIEPDIIIEQDYASPILYPIISRFLAFDFATEYARNNPSIPSPKDFVITDDIYNQFLEYLEDKDYSYSTSSERLLEELENKAKTEKYSDDIAKEIEVLREKFELDKQNDLIRFQDDIKEVLLSEIIVRYYHQKGRIEALLKIDKEIEAAVELLNDMERYNKILGR